MGTVDRLLEYISTEGRLCPLPERWNRLWEVLERGTGNGWRRSGGR